MSAVATPRAEIDGFIVPGCTATLLPVGSIPLSPDTLSADVEMLSVDEVADRLAVSTNRVRTLIRDHNLLAVSRGGHPVIPAVFFDDEGVVKHFYGLVGVLLDGGFTRDEAMNWLFTVHEDLDLYPAAALHTDSAREVIRRAQAQAF
ncbi:hypothetical protein GOALK_002_01460 [Gordonia alkanivorans NBRC 16433]|uniref:Uncharacterized protein n=1 Tax=Gordonia alkanivorans NBRC 16433 TaxID=1027371 RepID=F9VPZ2_9ACTN|nr:hypothetical protein GOALK_002_01460 [Gordonia alkanivorans NBRC 16433]